MLIACSMLMYNVLCVSLLVADEGAASVEQLKVFVSHASQDKLFADVLVHALREAGADVWYDEHNLGAGHLIGEITRELTARPAFVIVLTKAAFASHWVKDEMLWAYDLYRRDASHRIILPVVAAPIAPSDFVNEWLCLASLRRVEGPGDMPFPPEVAIERTVRLLGLTPAHTATTAEDDNIYVPDIGEVAYQMAQRALGEGRALKPWELFAVNAHRERNLGHYGVEPVPGLPRVPEASAELSEILASEPEYVYEWLDKGHALCYVERYAEALAAYERHLELCLYPTSVWTWRGKAAALRGLGRMAEAKQAIRRADELEQAERMPREHDPADDIPF